MTFVRRSWTTDEASPPKKSKAEPRSVYRTRILVKAGFKSNAEIIAYAIRTGLLWDGLLPILAAHSYGSAPDGDVFFYGLSPTHTRSPEKPPMPMHPVLLVDDEPTVVSGLKQLLAFEKIPEQLSYAEVSNRLNIPLGSVGPLYIRAKQKLRHELENRSSVGQTRTDFDHAVRQHRAVAPVRLRDTTNSMSQVASIILIGTALLLALSSFTLRLRHKYMRREHDLETARAALERAHEILRGRVEELEGAGAIGGEPSTARREPAFDIEKQRQRVEELATRLSQANEELETFSYSVSHDLRAPLRSIDGFSRELLIGYEDKLDEKGKHYLTRVRQAARRMSELIDDMLNLSRLSRKAMRRTSVDLTAIIEAVAAEAEERTERRRIEWTIEPELRAHADPDLIRIAFENLIGNAVKFTASRSDARIEIGTEGDTLFVRDNGVGFDPEYAQKLFAPFQRLHGSEFEGTGIGLAIVQRVIHRHDGRVWAESAPDRGATFRFTLGGPEQESK